MEGAKTWYRSDQWFKKRWASSEMLIPTCSKAEWIAGTVASLGPFSGLVDGMVGCAGPLQGNTAQWESPGSGLFGQPIRKSLSASGIHSNATAASNAQAAAERCKQWPCSPPLWSTDHRLGCQCILKSYAQVKRRDLGLEVKGDRDTEHVCETGIEWQQKLEDHINQK